MRTRAMIPATIVLALLGGRAAASPPDPRLEILKKEAAREVEALAPLTQEMVDMVFSFAELGFQELETSKYLTGVLRKHGFRVEEGISGMPTAWVARWGSGKPVIALGSDIDCIPKASQKPGVAYPAPIVEGAPGHGEGHNSGVPLNVTAAIALKRIMERERLGGTLVLWPGVAEEIVGGKAWFVRDGLFKDVDAVLFTHVSSDFKTAWGMRDATGLVSVEYTFSGESAHAAGAPWRGQSALDGVELMNVGWNYRREHLRLQQRSHYVVTSGGDQPNVVPSRASVWYYFRELEPPRIATLYELGNTMAKAAAMMSGTEVAWRILGTAYPQHMNRTLAETMHANIQAVGLPAWSEQDQRLATALQRELEVEAKGLPTELGSELEGPPKETRGGGSDDIGDVSWTVPTITLRFPANIPDLPGHSWANAVAMATPIAHKGVTAGAKAQALTVLDLLVRPELVEQAWAYFRETQTKDAKYQPFITDKDPPAVHLNRDTQERFRAELKKHYYDPSRHKSYLAQLGVEYPTLRPSPLP